MPMIAIDWSEPLVPPVAELPSEFKKRLKKLYGSVPATYFRLWHAPWVAEAALSLEGTPLTHLPYNLNDLILLVVSQDSACRYCYGAGRTMLRIMGRSEKEIEKLEAGLFEAELTPNQRIALEYARMLSRANPRPGVQEERGLRDSGFTPEAIAEVALQAAIVVVMNRLHTLIADQPEPMEKLGVAWYGPVVRPIARLMLRSKRRNAPGVAFAADYRGPFADLLAIFDGLPRAAVFSRILQAGMESPILPRRTKAWMLAVIGRAVGCDHSECEAIDLLKAEGIDAVAITRVIDHLGGPELDDIEMRLLRLARESVRYQPKAIQERVRAATATLKPPQIVEAAAICGIGNALARLSVLTERCD